MPRTLRLASLRLAVFAEGDQHRASLLEWQAELVLTKIDQKGVLLGRFGRLGNGAGVIARLVRAHLPDYLIPQQQLYEWLSGRADAGLMPEDQGMIGHNLLN